MTYFVIKTQKEKCKISGHASKGQKWNYTENINEAHINVERENKYQKGCQDRGCDCFCEVGYEE